MTFAAPLGLASAISYGTADFVSHFANRRSGVLRTMLYGQTLLAVLMTVALAATGGFGAIPVTQWVGVVTSDLAVLAATACLYRALATGSLAVVPPVTACYGAIAAGLSIAAGERATLAVLAGLGVVVAGGILATIPGRDRPAAGPRRPSGAGLAAAAALLYGVGLWAQGRFVVPRIGGLAMVWSYYAVGSVLLWTIAATRGEVAIPTTREAPALFATAFLGLAGYLALALGQATGQVAIVTALSSIASAVTVVLARVILKQRVVWHQWVGLAGVVAGLMTLHLA